MNIYIYGSKSFKKDVHNELDHSNIKFRLDESSSIVELSTLDELKNTIETHPNEIFLIDDAKIIKKEGLHQKFKFLIPKDGIEEEFLFENGVGDISFDSIEELSNHVISKIEDDGDEDYFEERDEIQESIADIVQDAYEENDGTLDDTDSSSDRIKLDDELSLLLSANIPETYREEDTDNSDLNAALKDYDPVSDGLDPAEEEDVFDFDEELKNLDFEIPEQEASIEDNESFEDDLKHLESATNSNDVIDDDFANELQNLQLDNSDFGEEPTPKVAETPTVDSSSLDMSELENLNITNEDFMSDEEKALHSNELANSAKVQDIQGDYEMAENFSSLDEISERDIIAALNGEEVSINDTQVLTSANPPVEKEAVSLDVSSAGDISQLLKQLLQDKTLEITVKLKD